MRIDALVLGAGIVGVSAAIHLLRRGRSVVLVDRRGPGEETSHGNAGIIERASVIPYGFPRDLPTLFKYGFNTATAVRYHPSFLPTIAPWLARYWSHSSPSGLAQAAREMLPLVERCIDEHDDLMAAAGTGHLMRKEGWIIVARSPAALDAMREKARKLNAYGIRHSVLDANALHAREPFLSDALVGGIHWHDPASVSDPGGVVKGYAALFERLGGRFVEADAAALTQDGHGWALPAGAERIEARDVVCALGAWSDLVYKPLGYRFPLAVKRGYHRHFRAAGNAVLNHPVLDDDAGIVLAPMARGIRLLTGAEFAPRDSAPTPVQITAAEPIARKLFPLGETIDEAPWMGNRPCLPDMRPIIGPAPRHHGLWFAFGHNHHGFTLGPVTGRVLAQMIVGEDPGLDTRPYRANRF